jgi:hypothetical protein
MVREPRRRMNHGGCNSRLKDEQSSSDTPQDDIKPPKRGIVKARKA